MLLCIPIFPIIAVTGYFTYKGIETVVMTNHYKYMTQIMKNVNNHLDIRISIVQDLLASISINDILLDKRNSDELYNRFEVYRFNNIDFISSIYFISEDGKSVSTSNIYMDLININIGDFDVYKRAVHSDGRIFWTNPYKSPFGGRVVTCARAVKDVKGVLIGVLAIDVSVEKNLLSLDDIKFGNNGKIYIMEEDGIIANMIMPADKFFNISEGIQFVKKYRESRVLIDNNPNIFEYKMENSGTLVIVEKEFDKFGWTLLGIIEKREILESVEKIKYYTLMMIGFIMVAFILITFLSAKYFSNPIKKIARSMDKVRLGNLNIKVESNREDEIGYLSNSFNDMTGRIQKLIGDLIDSEKEKRKYELKVLQAQINPHFLFNTLNSIDFMVTLEKTGQVHPMIQSLVSLLKYSIDKTDEYITIQEEIENLKNYVLIQKIRYNDKFEIHYDVSSEVLDNRILKLTLQPLVENSIFHGIQPKSGSGNIYIVSRKSGDEIEFQIMDDGVGMEQSTAKRLLYTGQGIHLRGFNSIGIKNVHERIKLFYGNEWGLNIQSVVNEGTCVTIRIPAVDKEDVADGQREV